MSLVEISSYRFSQVLDEIYRVIKDVRKNTNPPRSHEMLQELRDISSMAMEHFDEHVVPLLKESMQANESSTLNSTFPVNGLSVPSPKPLFQSTPPLNASYPRLSCELFYITFSLLVF